MGMTMTTCNMLIFVLHVAATNEAVNVNHQLAATMLAIVSVCVCVCACVCVTGNCQPTNLQQQQL